MSKLLKKLVTYKRQTTVELDKWAPPHMELIILCQFGPSQ